MPSWDFTKSKRLNSTREVLEYCKDGCNLIREKVNELEIELKSANKTAKIQKLAYNSLEKLFMSNEKKRDLEICQENREFICDCQPKYKGCQEDVDEDDRTSKRRSDSKKKPKPD